MMIWRHWPAEAYVYGFPLIFDLHEVGRFAVRAWARWRQHRSTASAMRRNWPVRTSGSYR